MVLNIKEHEQFFQKMCPKNVDYCISQTPRMAMVGFHNLFFENPTLQLKIRPLALPVPQGS